MRILNFHTSVLSLSIVLRTTKLQNCEGSCFMFYERWLAWFDNKTITSRDAFVSKNQRLKTQHNKGWEGLKEISEFSTQRERGGQKGQ